MSLLKVLAIKTKQKLIKLISIKLTCMYYGLGIIIDTRRMESKVIVPLTKKLHSSRGENIINRQLMPCPVFKRRKEMAIYICFQRKGI